MIVVGSGPSLTPSDCRRITGRAPIIAINTTYRLLPEASALYACDLAWWKVHHQELGKSAFAGDRWSMDPEAQRFGTYWVPADTGGGITKTPGRIYHGNNSGHQTIALAIAWGARRVILLGFDCGPSPTGARHWHADHPTQCGNPTSTEFDNWERTHALLARDAREANIEIINASAQTRLECYTRVSLKELFQ